MNIPSQFQVLQEKWNLAFQKDDFLQTIHEAKTVIEEAFPFYSNQRMKDGCLLSFFQEKIHPEIQEAKIFLLSYSFTTYISSRNLDEMQKEIYRTCWIVLASKIKQLVEKKSIFYPVCFFHLVLELMKTQDSKTMVMMGETIKHLIETNNFPFLLNSPLLSQKENILHLISFLNDLFLSFKDFHFLERVYQNYVSLDSPTQHKIEKLSFAIDHQNFIRQIATNDQRFLLFAFLTKNQIAAKYLLDEKGSSLNLDSPLWFFMDKNQIRTFFLENVEKQEKVKRREDSSLNAA